MKAICMMVLFLGAITAIGFGTSYFNYSGANADDEYGKMCDKVQSRILLKQKAQCEFSAKVKCDLGKLKDEFNGASIPERARRFVEMQRQFVSIPSNGTNVLYATAYNGIKVTKEGELSFFPMREKYYDLEGQMPEKWGLLSTNDIAKAKWNEMISKIEAAEEAVAVANQAMKDAENVLSPAAKK